MISVRDKLAGQPTTTTVHTPKVRFQISPSITDGMTSFADDDERRFHTRVSQVILLLSPILTAILIFGRPSTYGKLQQQTKQQQQQQQCRPTSSATSIGLTWTWLGPLIPSRIAWMVFESPCLFWVVSCLYWRFGESDDNSNIASNRTTLPPGNALLLTWFAIHYIYRSIVYPLQQSSASQTPIGVVLLAWSYCMVNGYLQSRPLTVLSVGEEDGLGVEIDAHTSSFVVGMTLCILGFTIVIMSDRTLLRLKKNGMSSRTAGGAIGQHQTRYSIPHGGLFDYVSSPHYLGEIIEWTGYCIASGRTWASLSFVVWTAANLVPRAIQTHEWYRQTFDGRTSSSSDEARRKKNDDDDGGGDDNMIPHQSGEIYPPGRKAIIPFIL